MSHGKERTEKTCLNCGAQLQGRYCHVCGQENIEPKENFGHLASHFFQDITHFDGKFFTTLKPLLLKPGFLSTEYLHGRRAAYLHPIRMYIFTSLVFFFVLFSSQSRNRVVSVNRTAQNINVKDSITEELKEDTGVPKIKFTPGLPDTGARSGNFSVFKINNKGLPNTIAKYDSMQSSLPAKKRDGWIARTVSKKLIELGQKYNNSPQGLQEELLDYFTHAIPKMMFVFLPLVALVLQLLYMRRRKEFYYVSHGIFVIYFYIAAYILMLLSLFFGWLKGLSGWGIFTFLQVSSILAILFYLYKAMRNFYHQSRGKTMLKFFIFNLLVFVLFVVMATVLLAISLYEV
jgi:hypothetical protein